MQSIHLKVVTTDDFWELKLQFMKLQFHEVYEKRRIPGLFSLLNFLRVFDIELLNTDLKMSSTEKAKYLKGST